MITQPESYDKNRQTLQGLQNATYAKAKYWSNGVVGLQVGLYLGGVAAIFYSRLGITYPWFALPLALLNAGFTSCATRHKSAAEALKRQHEYLDAFGWQPSRRQLSCLRAELPPRLRPALDELLTEGITFASNKPKGPERALDNLCESAWFSQHLTATCARFLGSLFILALTISITLLLMSALTIAGTPVGLAAAKCVSSTLLFLLSAGVLRTWLSFQRFSRKAEQIDAEAARLLERGAVGQFETQRLLGEYQLARASAPNVPTWIWRLYRDRLNKIWTDRTSTNQS